MLTIEQRYAALCARRRLAYPATPGSYQDATTRHAPEDTGREHHPGSLAGALRFHASRSDAAAMRERVAQLPHEPECAFCGAPGASDVFHEEDCPALPCCADEDACHERFTALDAPTPVRIPGTPRHR